MSFGSICYLILSFLSGVIELGVVIIAARDSIVMLIVPLVGLAYQIGALFKDPFEIPEIYYLGILLLSSCFSFFLNQNSISLLLYTLLVSIGIQGARGMLSAHHNTSVAIKRTSRILGFALSGFVSWNLLPIVPLLSLVCAVPWYGRKKVRHALIKERLFLNRLGITMIIHQCHYFCYAYVVPLVLMLSYGINYKYVGLLFCIGWISYVCSEMIFGNKNIYKNFIIGHCIAAVALGLIYVNNTRSLGMFLLAWFTTGIGGGTVYCLRRAQNVLNDTADLDALENIGHVIGAFLSVLIVTATEDPILPFAAASILACGTIALWIYAHLAIQRSFTQE